MVKDDSYTLVKCYNCSREIQKNDSVECCQRTYCLGKNCVKIDFNVLHCPQCINKWKPKG